MMMWAATLLFFGTINGVQANAASVAVGATVTVTVTGSNPCGAAHINYGDGTAITYAITGLPTSHSHKYEKPGTYTIVARGMGNCDGETSTKIEVRAPAPTPPPPSAPPPPPPPAPTPPAAPVAEITAVNFSPSPAIVRQPMLIDVQGRGSCGFVVDYGDGNQQEFSGPLPRRVTHTYAVVDTYTVIVGPVAPCVGKFTQKLQVVPRGGPRITGLQLSPSLAQPRQAVSFTVDGSGTCTYTIDFGDGNQEERTKPLADRLTHVYPAGGTYTIIVTAGAGCSGSVRRVLTVM